MQLQYRGVSYENSNSIPEASTQEINSPKKTLSLPIQMTIDAGDSGEELESSHTLIAWKLSCS